MLISQYYLIKILIPFNFFPVCSLFYETLKKSFFQVVTKHGSWQVLSTKISSFW
ncbi:hypothetical protein MtrunA17_Chr3g0138421 [Medicago truncatula]|uniref:Uncharacterized protein n=1 Tax=Medicago truncatula TaxID=3880 RepID=A0A396J2S4_MEDTR|nr:hypothetical protein MtrunA17_Chr3g0138421 [Medicago truncatula]